MPVPITEEERGYMQEALTGVCSIDSAVVSGIVKVIFFQALGYSTIPFGHEDSPEASKTKQRSSLRILMLGQ